jgi:hypothetical protein
MWNPDLLIDYYYQNNEDNLPLEEKLVRLKMELSKINKSARLSMNFTVALTHYSPLAASNNTVCALITKDQGDQKEVNKLLSLKKNKFEEETQLSEEKKEYQNEYNKLFGEDQVIESIILYKENIIGNIKEIKTSQKGDEPEKKIENIQKVKSSQKSMRESQKILLKNVFKFMSVNNQGNMEMIGLLSLFFLK